MSGFYQDIARILKKIAADELLQTFRENYVDDETLPLLDVLHLKEIIPLGTAIKFVATYTSGSFRETGTANIASEHYCSEEPVICTPNFDSLVDPLLDVYMQPENVPLPIGFLKTESLMKLEPTTVLSKNFSCMGDNAPKRQNFHTGSHTSPPSKMSKQGILNSVLRREYPRQPCNHVSSTTPASLHQLRITNGNVLKEVLKLSDAGVAILTVYKKHNTLDKAFSTKLARLVVSHEASGNAQCKILKRDFERLSRSIIELFPTEEISTYYVAFKRVNAKNFAARGRLVETWNNRRKFLLRTGVIVRRTRNITPISKAAVSLPKPRTFELNNEGPSLNHTSVEPGATVEAASARLKNNYQSERALFFDWKLTGRYRLNKKKGSIEEYFKAYPCLMDPEMGPKLMNLDFKRLYEDKESNFFINWSSCADLLLKLAQESMKKNDKKWMKLISLSGIDVTVTDPGVKSISALLLLPYFFPVPTSAINRETKSSEPFRVSKEEMASEFIKQIPSEDLVDTQIQVWKDLRKSRNQSIHPVTVLVGSPWNIQSVFVLIYNQKYRFSSIFTAFDFCFKSFSVLNTKFPTEVNLPYLFVQRYVYGINTQVAPCYMYILELEKSLKHIKKSKMEVEIF